jgi:hypothetical protein
MDWTGGARMKTLGDRMPALTGGLSVREEGVR